ncbi:hypothetical protein CLV65_0248 [Pseudoscardovia suis]|nr:hypothetical protein CLV65_0248 [Pseudoscardovia suis]
MHTVHTATAGYDARLCADASHAGRVPSKHGGSEPCSAAAGTYNGCRCKVASIAGAGAALKRFVEGDTHERDDHSH